MSAVDEILSTKPFRCAACHAAGDQLLPVDPGIDTQGTALFACAHCASITMWPQPDMDYALHAGSETELRDYVEMNCSIHDIAKAVLPAVMAADAKRYLDVGCGFGFSLDIVRRVAGCEVAGVEPALYGRAGRDLLGVPVFPKILSGAPGDQEEPELRRPFDVVFASEVIEHVSDPDGFLTTLRAYLTPGGILALTTPRAAAIGAQQSRNETLAVISPGAHVFLYSGTELKAALQRAGFDHVTLIESGVTQIAYASREPFRIPQTHPGELTTQYLERALEDGSLREPVRTGLQYRLYRSLIEQAEWEAASALDREIEIRHVRGDLDVDRYEDFLANYRACEPSLGFLRGILYLVHERRREEAHDWFMSAFHLCCLKLRIAPAVCAVEADLVWRALFHAALSARHAGNPDLAARTWAIADEAESLDHLPPIPADIRERSLKEL